MSERDVRVIMASAGSGKTWELTTQFLRVLAAGVPPERILASTFTRKAAGEILGRIFERLAAAAADDKACDELNAALGGAPRSRRDYGALLARAARSVHRFRVQTLDSFFVALAQGFTSELGLSPGWSIADDLLARRARGDALSRVLDAGERLEWIVLLRELERAQSGRQVHAALSATIAVGQALARESGVADWSRIATQELLSIEALEHALVALRELPVPLTAKGEPAKPWLAAVANLIECVSTGAWAMLGSKGLAGAVVAGKAKFDRWEIESDVRAVVAALARHAAACVGADLALQNRATRRLLDHFELEYGRTQRAVGLLRFDDLPHALAHGANGIAHGDRLEDIAFRLDGRIDHLLLDEFQDTSPAQWRVLEPWIDELASGQGVGGEKRSFLCVGDSKQSIYGWRSADPRLLEGLASHLGVTAEKLSQSRRSAQVVLDAVNTVFGGIANNGVFPMPGSDDAGDAKRCAAQTAAISFEHNFDAHSAHYVDQLGEVHVHTSAAAGNAADIVQAAIARALDIVEEIHERAPAASIAVLLRRNRCLPSIVQRLREKGIAASDEAGNRITDSAAVQAVLSLLHWIDHPGDSAARFHVASSPLAPILGLDAATPIAWTSRARTEIQDRGLPEWLERLRPSIASGWSEWDARRFGGLVDLAVAQRAETGVRLCDFIERAREQRAEEASAAQVRVMTIHAAKGLEFDAVVVLELDRKLLHTTPTFVWSRADEDDPWQAIEAVSCYANDDVRRLLELAGDPTLSHLLEAAQRREVRDELSGLYVAMTRARHRLDLVIAPDAAKKPPLTLASILRSAFGLGFEALSPASVVWSAEGSDAAWMEATRRVAAAAAPAEAAARISPLVFARARRPREFARASPSALEAPWRVPTAELLTSPSSVARRRGSRWHAWFERIEWLESFADSDADLCALARAVGLGGADLDRDLGAFRSALGRPSLSALLSLGTWLASEPGAEIQVWRERRFAQVVATADGTPQIESGAFDRVVLVRERGVVVRAEVLDFKTDRADDELQISARVEHHAPQLRAYRAALGRILGLDESRIAARLVFVGCDSVRDV